MAMCTVCKSEIPVYERRCQSCGAGVVRDADSLLANAPTDKELSRARWCHLLALPGMLVLAVLVDVASDRVGYLSLVPLNLLIPFVYWLPHLKSPFVRSVWRRAVQLPASLDAGDLRRMVRSVSSDW